ncbi:DNA glycosylase [Lichtheimia hyalospora FSU 10163]|nr:DNA glycosylase [Lichtheimia hyalospora FSU 10163]
MVDDREPDVAIEECVQSKRLYHNTTYHHISPETRSLIQQQLLEWYDREKRTNMPWRKEYRNDLDREALGQRAYEGKTQVATVIDYYNRWMEAFPTIFDLAKADIERVNTLWAGLGYYSRARRLWEGAQKVVKQFDGILPNNAKDLQHHIPGVGRYTAGAVASIVFGQETPVVDGNVIRVIARLRALGADPKKANVVELFWEIAQGLVSHSRPGDFNQALMELGARVCTPQGPDCGACPIKAHCHAYAQVETHSRLKTNGFWKATPAGQKRKRDMEHECKYCLEIQTDLTDDDYAVTRYPTKPEKKKPRDEECAVYILQSNEADKSKFLISKRPETGLLAGLWEFPSLELDTLDTTYEQRAAKATGFLKERYGISLSSSPASYQRHDLGNVVHLFSHIRKVYHIEWIKIDLNQEAMDMAVAMAVSKSDKDQARWVDLQELKKSPIPTGLKKAIKLMENFEKVT